MNLLNHISLIKEIVQIRKIKSTDIPTNISRKKKKCMDLTQNSLSVQKLTGLNQHFIKILKKSMELPTHNSLREQRSTVMPTRISLTKKI